MSKSQDFSSTELPPGVSELDAVVVRKLGPADLDAVARIDEAATGVPRPEFYRRRLDQACRKRRHDGPRRLAGSSGMVERKHTGQAAKRAGESVWRFRGI